MDGAWSRQGADARAERGVGARAGFRAESQADARADTRAGPTGICIHLEDQYLFCTKMIRLDV